MRAVTVQEPGGPEVLRWEEVPDPVCGSGEVIVDVAATAVNRSDLLQRQGLYPPPPGASDILGLECSGVVSEVGDGVTGWAAGDEVCALLSGGGYAERVAVPAGQLLPRPAGVELATAGALPEVTCTVWSNVFLLARLRHGERFLVHGGSSGIGTMAIQLAARAGAQVFTTAGTTAKLDFCRELGAEVLINYREEDFAERVKEETGGAGVDVVLDNMGAKYLGRNVDVLADGGRLVSIGMQGGTKAELDLGKLMRKRGSVHATTLRSRPATGRGSKAEVVAAVRRAGRAPGRGAGRRAGRRAPDRRPPPADVAGRRGPPGRRGQRAHRQGPADAGGLTPPGGHRAMRISSSPFVPTRRTSDSALRFTSVQPRNQACPDGVAVHSPARCRSPASSMTTSRHDWCGGRPATRTCRTVPGS